MPMETLHTGIGCVSWEQCARDELQRLEMGMLDASYGDFNGPT